MSTIARSFGNCEKFLCLFQNKELGLDLTGSELIRPANDRKVSLTFIFQQFFDFLHRAQGSTVLIFHGHGYVEEEGRHQDEVRVELEVEYNNLTTVKNSPLFVY